VVAVPLSFEGKAKLLSMGTYPDVPLQTHPAKPDIKGARELRNEARALLAGGVDPSAHRKAGKAARSDRAANSFEVVTREWYGKMIPRGTLPTPTRPSAGSSAMFSPGLVASP
jgi:hypothetical protein